MSRIKHQQVSLGAAFINLETKFDGSVYRNDGVLQGTTTSSVPADTFSIVPNFHYVLPINKRWSLGVEETTPFGLSTKYTDINTSDFVSNLATTTELQTANLNPSVSYLINRYFSVGAGFDALYGEATYNNTAYFSPLDNKLKGWGYGYNAGVLVQFTSATRFGLSYRSPITISAKGPSSYDFFGSTTKSTVSANFPLPATTMMSLYHDVNQHLAIMASAFYTQWSCFHTLVIKNMAQLGNTATVAINENYRDTWNLAVGSRYKFNQHIALEAGFGHDETPTRIPYRDVRLPDDDRYIGSVGLNVHPSADFEWSMGWTHLFTGHTAINDSGGLNTSQSTIDPLNFSYGIGTVHSNVNLFGIQLTWNV
jgi:long-chain fatty acid transport protein